MKKLLMIVAVLWVAFLGGAVLARGAEPETLPAGEYPIDYQLIGGGLWCHAYTIDAMNPATGEFSGTGRYLPDPAYTEIITGKFDGTVITFHVLYTGFNAGYTVDAVGRVDANGQLSGAAVSPGQQFTWTCSRRFAAKDCGPAAATWWDGKKLWQKVVELSRHAVPELKRLAWGSQEACD